MSVWIDRLYRYSYIDIHESTYKNLVGVYMQTAFRFSAKIAMYVAILC